MLLRRTNRRRTNSFHRRRTTKYLPSSTVTTGLWLMLIPNSIPVLDDYQVVAKNFLLERTGALLCDDRGVGKSFPAIEAAMKIAPDGPNLFVVPAYLVPNWTQMLIDYGVRDVVMLYGSQKERLTKLLEGHSWVVCNYEMLSTDVYIKY